MQTTNTKQAVSAAIQAAAITLYTLFGTIKKRASQDAKAVADTLQGMDAAQGAQVMALVQAQWRKVDTKHKDEKNEDLRKVCRASFEYLGRVVAKQFAYDSWSIKTESFQMTAKPVTTGKEKGVTGEQVAAGEAMQGATKAGTMPADIHPTTRLAAIVAELRGMIEKGALSGVDVELAVSLMVKDCAKGSKGKKAA